MPDRASAEGVQTIGDLPDAPKYNIKAVCQQTGIRPVTLRAWERRYQLLEPQRSASNYRLYSERDVALLRWLKSQVDGGLSIGNLAAELADLRRQGAWPKPLAAPLPAPQPVGAAAPMEYAQQLYLALVAHDESAAGEVLGAVHARFDLKVVCLEVLTPCLVAIGEAWEQGRVRITTEHFASNFLRGRLQGLLHAQPLSRSGARILVGCAPSELHDIASLMLALLLRREGYRVEFLGQDVNAEDLVEYTRLERPQLVCLSAGSETAARELGRLAAGLASLRPRPKLGYGGRIFNQKPALRTAIVGHFLGADLGEALATIRQTLGS